jgi:hypothetical protein
MAAIDATGIERVAFIRQAVEDRLGAPAGTAVELDAQTLAMLDGVVPGRAEGVWIGVGPGAFGSWAGGAQAAGRPDQLQVAGALSISKLATTG